MKTMSKKMESKKLSLGKETLKALSDDQLQGIAAGHDPTLSFYVC